MTSERESAAKRLSGPAPQARGELGRRVASALVLSAIVLGALLIGGIPFAIVWLVAGIVGLAEWLSMTRSSPDRPLLVLGGVTLAGLAIGQQIEASASILLAIATAGLVLLAIAARDGASRRSAAIGLLAAAVIVLVPTSLRNDPGIGIAGPAWMFAVVWSTDVAAYFTGRAVGGPKLMPSVSPNKTWSGAIGGLIAGMVAGTGLAAAAAGHGFATLDDLSPLAVAVASAAASVVSQAGDLFESGLKRRYGVKDSGRSIPGHGGIMDRLDGFFAVALLVALALFVRFLLAP